MKKTEDQIWEIYVEMGQFERHFSSHQVTMRTLASTWLIASFAGIGFVISTKIELEVPVQLLVFFISSVTFLGLNLLWFLDIRLYQRLLDAAYYEGLYMERKYSWLPQVRVKMRALLKGKGLHYPTYYYIAAMTIMLIISAYGLVQWLILQKNTPVLIYASILLSIIIIYLTWKIILKQSSTTIEMEEEIKEIDLKRQE